MFPQRPDSTRADGIAKASKPYARLEPLVSVKNCRKPGRLGGVVQSAFFDPLPERELLAWYGECSY
jgi:hypothetical protein